ncbi:hypothetical protein IAD21_02292 [Abditibacteriota bacterium]|nr:hypothetical protein IAD21_02292 [Abditibacteriota bacterium]
MTQFAVSSPHISQSAVYWQLDSGFRCALYSDDAEVLERASGVLAAESAGNTGMVGITLSWHIGRPDENDAWWAQPLTDSTPEIKAETLAELLAHIEYGALQEFLAGGTDSFFSLHAALLTKNGRSVVIVGPKEAGKSTLACALWTLRGWTLRGDDSVLVDTHNNVCPSPRRVSLRYGSRALLGEELWSRLSALPSTFHTGQGLLFHPHELENQNSPEAAPPLSAIFFLARRESKAASAQTTPLAPAPGALALLPYSTFLLPRGEYLLCPSRVDWGAALPRLTTLAACVPMFDLGRGPLDAMTHEVERLVFHANPIATSAS